MAKKTELSKCPNCGGKFVNTKLPTHTGERKAVICKDCGYENSDASLKSDE